MSGLRRKFSEKRPTVGSWMVMGDAFVPDLLAGLGFDWLVVDLEHSVTGLEKASELFDKITLNGMVPLVRLPRVDEDVAKKCLDAGARGVIAPMVRDRADVQKLIDACFYPPLGKRGVGLFKAQGFGDGFDDYRDSHCEELLVIAQIETKEAVENLPGILDMARLDGVMVGPYDLSASLGAPGDFASPAFRGALDAILGLAAKAGKPVGFHVVEPSGDEVAAKFSEGYGFVALGTDGLFLRRSAQAEMRKFSRAHG